MKDTTEKWAVFSNRPFRFEKGFAALAFWRFNLTVSHRVRGTVRLCWQGKRVSPFQLWKTGEIGIGRDQFATVFHRESCQMCVRDQIRYGLAIREHLLKYSPMPFGRPNDSCTRLFQPALYTSKGLFKGEWVFENPGISPNPNKGGQNCPAETNRVSPGELAIPPYTRFLVPWMKRVFRVQKNIRIDEYQRKSSPSI